MTPLYLQLTRNKNVQIKVKLKYNGVKLYDTIKQQ